MKSIQVTLYEIFGYLFPGAIFLIALFLVYWALFLPAQQNLDGLTTLGWLFVLAVAYVLGHMVQALANLTFKPAVDLVLKQDAKLCLPNEVIQRAEAEAKRFLGLKEDVVLSPGTTYDICDHYLQQKGDTASRDIYVYREGFYRGVAVASFALAVGFIILFIRAAFDGEAVITIWGIGNNLTLWQLGTLAIASFLVAGLSFQRYRRFGKYRVANSVYGCLVISDDD